jgi:hypothetical protein
VLVGPKICYDWHFNDLNEQLKLREFRKNYTQQQDSQATHSYSDYYHTRLVNMLLAELVPFVLIPCASIVGFYLNWKIIETIKYNKRKELKEDFYKYMSVNAKFNCLYCIILVFYPMTSCTWRASYYFCSTIFTSQFVQYYKIVMIAYFGETFKMCANISYLMMTLNRYLLIGKDHVRWLVAVAKLEFKWVIRGSFLVSAIVNLGHGWEYEAVKELALSQYGTYYARVNGYSYSDYPQANQDLQFLVYSIVFFNQLRLLLYFEYGP